MGAGRHRWWEEPPFAAVRPRRTEDGRLVYDLVVGGTVVLTRGATPKAHIEDFEERARYINSARGIRTAYLEDENRRLKHHLVMTDQAMDAGNVLASLSDGALLAELDRRKAQRGVYDRSDASHWSGEGAVREWAPEYLGEVGYRPRGCRLPYCGERAVGMGRVAGREYERAYCHQHSALDRIEADLEQLYRGMGPQNRIDALRHERDETMRRFVEMMDTRPRNMTATQVAEARAAAVQRLAPTLDAWQRQVLMIGTPADRPDRADAIALMFQPRGLPVRPQDVVMITNVDVGGNDSVAVSIEGVREAGPAPAPVAEPVHYNARRRGARPEALCMAERFAHPSGITDNPAAITCPTCRDLELAGRPNRRKPGRPARGPR